MEDGNFYCATIFVSYTSRISKKAGVKTASRFVSFRFVPLGGKMAGDKWQDVRRDVRRLADRSIFGLAINRGKDRRDLSIFHDRFNLVRRFCHSFVMHRDNPSIDSLLDPSALPFHRLLSFSFLSIILLSPLLLPSSD